MSPYWVCVVLRGGVETRNPVFVKMSQTRSSQTSFFPVTHNRILPVPGVRWIWRRGWPRRPAWAQLHVCRPSCPSLNGSAVSAAQGRPRAFPLYYHIYNIWGGKNRDEQEPPLCRSPCQSDIRLCGCFQHVPFPQRSGVRDKPFLWSSASPPSWTCRHRRSVTVLHQPDSSHPPASTVVLQPERLWTPSARWDPASCLQTCPCLTKRCLRHL